MLNELDEILISGCPYTGRGEILDKLTPEDRFGWSLEKADNFTREQRKQYNCLERKGNPRTWMTPQQQEDSACEEQ